MNSLSLYYFPTCPYCIKVLNAIDELGISGIELRDKRAEPVHEADLREATGRTTVPCLRIDRGDGSEWMHESDDIVQYLQSL